MQDPNVELTSEEIKYLWQHLGNLASATTFFYEMREKLGLSYEEAVMFDQILEWSKEEMGKMTISDGIEYRTFE